MMRCFALFAVALAVNHARAANMCKTDSDLQGATIAEASDGTTCTQLSDYLLTQFGSSPTTWDNNLCASVPTTTWTEGGAAQRMDDHLNHFGPTCCGSYAQTRCLPDNNMCKTDSSLQGATIATGTTTCAQISNYLLPKFASSPTNWNNDLCASVPTTTWTDSGTQRMGEHLSNFGPTCCGSYAQTRCLPDNNMCNTDSDLQGTKIAWTATSTTCDQMSSLLFTKFGSQSTNWDDCLCASVPKTTWMDTDGAQRMDENLALFGPTCCGSSAQTRCVSSTTTSASCTTTTLALSATTAPTSGAASTASGSLGVAMISGLAVLVATHVGVAARS